MWIIKKHSCVEIKRCRLSINIEWQTGIQVCKTVVLSYKTGMMGWRHEDFIIIFIVLMTSLTVHSSESVPKLQFQRLPSSFQTYLSSWKITSVRRNTAFRKEISVINRRRCYDLSKWEKKLMNKSLNVEIRQMYSFID